MTRDDIAKLFEKANGWNPATFLNTMDDLARFADLVAAHERERVMQVAQSMKADLEARFETVYMEGAMAGAIAEREKVAAWVGLEQSDMPDGEDPMYDDPRFIAGMVWAAKKLMEKNGV